MAQTIGAQSLRPPVEKARNLTLHQHTACWGQYLACEAVEGLKWIKETKKVQVEIIERVKVIIFLIYIVFPSFVIFL